MAKVKTDFLDVEAMKLGFQRMLDEVNAQLREGDFSEAIRAVLTDRKHHIENRLEELQ